MLCSLSFLGCLGLKYHLEILELTRFVAVLEASFITTGFNEFSWIRTPHPGRQRLMGGRIGEPGHRDNCQDNSLSKQLCLFCNLLSKLPCPNEIWWEIIPGVECSVHYKYPQLPIWIIPNLILRRCYCRKLKSIQHVSESLSCWWMPWKQISAIAALAKNSGYEISATSLLFALIRVSLDAYFLQKVLAGNWNLAIKKPLSFGNFDDIQALQRRRVLQNWNLPSKLLRVFWKVLPTAAFRSYIWFCSICAMAKKTRGKVESKMQKLLKSVNKVSCLFSIALNIFKGT